MVVNDMTGNLASKSPNGALANGFNDTRLNGDHSYSPEPTTLLSKFLIGQKELESYR